MQDKEFLMIPGPTPVPQSVLLDMAKHPMGHRSSEFSSLLSEVYNDLKWAFQTKKRSICLHCKRNGRNGSGYFECCK